MTANPVKGQTTLTLKDGRAFSLVLDHEALIGIEQTYGKPLHRALGEAAQGFLGAIAAMAQAAFAHHHPEVTRADVLAIVMSDNRDDLTDALTKAAELAFPDQKPAGNAAAPKVKKSPRGKTSGRNGAKSA